MTSATDERALALAWPARRAEQVRTSEKEFDDASREFRRLFSEAGARSCWSSSPPAAA